MLKHVKTIGAYHIVQDLDDDRILYNVQCIDTIVDTFTSEEKAERFIIDELLDNNYRNWSN